MYTLSLQEDYFSANLCNLVGLNTKVASSSAND